MINSSINIEMVTIVKLWVWPSQKNGVEITAGFHSLKCEDRRPLPAKTMPIGKEGKKICGRGTEGTEEEEKRDSLWKLWVQYKQLKKKNKS